MVLSQEEQKQPIVRNCKPAQTPIGKFFVSLILFVLLNVLVINVYVSAYGQKYILKDPTVSPFTASSSMPVAIVLGASVYSDGTLSPMLEERAKTALMLYHNGMAKKLLVSGDNRTPSYNEVMPIRKYLLDNKVPPEDIFTDFAGLNTYDSMYRAKNIFGADNLLIVTQSFHLPRAIFAARQLGLNAYGIPADLGGIYLKNDAREVFATTKTFFKVATHAQSLFLGRQISIEGDGRDSLH